MCSLGWVCGSMMFYVGGFCVLKAWSLSPCCGSSLEQQNRQLMWDCASPHAGWLFRCLACRRGPPAGVIELQFTCLRLHSEVLPGAPVITYNYTAPHCEGGGAAERTQSARTQISKRTSRTAQSGLRKKYKQALNLYSFTGPSVRLCVAARTHMKDPQGSFPEHLVRRVWTV